MSDTTTTLNPGSGGDVMDESLVTQPGDGITQAKRPRVQLGGNLGEALVEPVNATPGANPYALPTIGVGLVDDSRPSGYVDGELRALSLTSDGRLRVAASQAVAYLDMFGDTGPIECVMLNPYNMSSNPWGI